jgi:metal-responsive CopG/Arc/MetJ family transcriptional regulator
MISFLGTAMRTLVDIPDNQLRELTNLGRQTKKSRAALVREAVAAYLAARKHESEADAFGLWGSSVQDGLAYQRKSRAEW